MSIQGSQQVGLSRCTKAVRFEAFGDSDKFPIFIRDFPGIFLKHTRLLPFLAFWISLLFSLRRVSLFLKCLSLLFEGFWGFGRDKKSFFSWWFSLRFTNKKQGKEGQGPERLGVPPWSLHLSKKLCDFEVSSLGILAFRKGHLAQFDLILTPIPRASDLF